MKTKKGFSCIFNKLCIKWTEMGSMKALAVCGLTQEECHNMCIPESCIWNKKKSITIELEDTSEKD